MYALMEFKGKQYKAEKGAILKVDRIEGEKGSEVTIDSVLLVSGDNMVKVGGPYVSGVKVKAVVEDHGKDKKIIVFKYESKKDYRRKAGHRQQFTTIRVQDIVGV